MSLGLLIFASLTLGVGAWLLFVWSVRSGQYDDPEGPKYRMLDDGDERSSPPPRSLATGAAPERGGRSGTPVRVQNEEDQV